MKLARRVGMIVLLLAVAAGIFMAWQIGPRNLIGMLRYDQRREGALRVGDAAPDVPLTDTEGVGVNLAHFVGGKPLVLVFGSFT